MVRRTSRVSFRDFFTPADSAFVNWTVRHNGTLLADPRLRRSMGDEAPEDALDEGLTAGMAHLRLADVNPAAGLGLRVGAQFTGEDRIEPQRRMPQFVESVRDLVGEQPAAPLDYLGREFRRGPQAVPSHFEARANAVDSFASEARRGADRRYAEEEGVGLAPLAAQPTPLNQGSDVPCAELKQERAVLIQELRFLRDNQQRVAAEMTALENRIPNLRGKRDQLVARARSLAGKAHDRSPAAAELARLRNEIAVLDGQIRGLEARLAELLQWWPSSENLERDMQIKLDHITHMLITRCEGYT